MCGKLLVKSKDITSSGSSPLRGRTLVPRAAAQGVSCRTHFDRSWVSGNSGSCEPGLCCHHLSIVTWVDSGARAKWYAAAYAFNRHHPFGAAYNRVVLLPEQTREMQRHFLEGKSGRHLNSGHEYPDGGNLLPLRQGRARSISGCCGRAYCFIRGRGSAPCTQLTRQSNTFRPTASTGRPCQGAVYCWRYKS